MVAKAANVAPAVQTSEPIYVFGSDPAEGREQSAPTFAASVHGAVAGTVSGPTGNAYAIPCRDNAGELLPLRTIATHVATFIEHARNSRDVIYHVNRFGCEEGGHGDPAMAHLFSRVPPNCRLPGVWLRHLDPRSAVRILLFDPDARMKDERWLMQLRRYLSLSMPVWNVPVVEIVSFGSPRTIVSNEVVTKRLSLKHRVLGANATYYGRHAERAAEQLAVWYSTHFVSLCDFMQTMQPIQMRITRLASSAGLVMESIEWSPDT